MAERDRVWVGQDFLLWVGDADGALLSDLDGRIQRGDHPELLLAVITSAGLDAAPAFACATVEGDSVRAWVRGRGRLELRADDGSRTALDAEGVRTWRESVHDAIESVVPAVDGTALDWLIRRGPRTEVAPPGSDLAPTALDPDPGSDASATAEPAPTATVDDSPSPAEDHEFDFSNLLEHTRYRDVESAAVRDLDPEPDGEQAAGEADARALAPDEDGADEIEPHAPDVAPEPPLDSETLGVEQALPDPPPSPPTARPSQAPLGAASDDQRRAMISQVPGRSEATQVLAGESEPPVELLGDHDGRTMTTEQLRRMASQGVSHPVRDHVGPQVRAVICPDRHPNPPSVDVCRSCGAPIAERTVHTIPRPTIARAHFQTGMVVELDRPQILGRRPTADVWTASPEIPGLVTLPSPEGDVSRVHAALHVEEWEILIEDCGSTNGTEVQLPGQERERLREHDPKLIVPGTEVTLAGVVSFTLRVPRP